MRADDVSGIRNLSLFRSMRDEMFMRLIENGFVQQFPPGLVLIQESDRADFLHILVEGMVEMFASMAGRETTLDFVCPVGIFILAAVLSDQAYLQSARTLEKSRVLMIPAEKVRQTMTSDPAFMQAIVTELARAYRGTIRDLKDQKLRTGTERLANWLLRSDRKQGNHGRLEIQFEKRTLASRLGMTAETLSRAFAALRAQGVEVRGSRIELIDRTALARFAQPDPLIDSPDDEISIRSL
ncbi:cyclic nucleotide-binding domain-containing protein [Mycobacterium sp. KBS0706]|uniref:cyclic nucleotide-binding domain-containing protein n=1 Tax=Mycobacterium sp. KBS0706 TaxID=2578109 RepID=UPI00110FE68D|nr:cyclic nucleotide-binding domain-containing protein [Mycobacterium sp. KBS0706]TSD84639.1 cyclic nucleotide-binding domain-containing protein [Mycobacterium sp. KBS0706]